jgi:hypothetical protein
MAVNKRKNQVSTTPTISYKMVFDLFYFCASLCLCYPFLWPLPPIGHTYTCHDYLYIQTNTSQSPPPPIFLSSFPKTPPLMHPGSSPGSPGGTPAGPAPPRRTARCGRSSAGATGRPPRRHPHGKRRRDRAGRGWWGAVRAVGGRRGRRRRRRGRCYMGVSQWVE